MEFAIRVEGMEWLIKIQAAKQRMLFLVEFRVAIHPVIFELLGCRMALQFIHDHVLGLGTIELDA